MAVVTLGEVKEHVRVDHFDDDGLLNGYIDAAVDYLARIGCHVDDDPLPIVIKQAALLLVGHWYTNREAVESAASFELPLGFNALVASVREVTI